MKTEVNKIDVEIRNSLSQSPLLGTEKVGKRVEFELAPIVLSAMMILVASHTYPSIKMVPIDNG